MYVIPSILYLYHCIYYTILFVQLLEYEFLKGKVCVSLIFMPNTGPGISYEL